MRLDSLTCRRGRELVSLALDGEISELEEALLGSHLAACADCREFRAQIAPATALLRAAPFEEPARAIVLPPRRAFGFRSLQVGAAAAVVAIAAAASLFIGPFGSRNQPAAHRTGAVSAADNMRQLQLIRRPELIPTLPVGKAGGRLPL
jgi:hypothetical protein